MWRPQYKTYIGWKQKKKRSFFFWKTK
jgi:hypothetical protein